MITRVPAVIEAVVLVVAVVYYSSRLEALTAKTAKLAAQGSEYPWMAALYNFGHFPNCEPQAPKPESKKTFSNGPMKPIVLGDN